ncbi:MAG: hypothetical protein ACE5H9_15920 [Anaerolineae bacterium]
MFKSLLAFGLCLSFGLLLAVRPAAVVAGPPGSIAIEVVALVPHHTGDAPLAPSTTAFNFSGDLGEFTLDSSSYRQFQGLPAGTYTIVEHPSEGWRLAGILCDDGTVLENPNPPLITIDLPAGETVHCIFHNAADVDPSSTYWSFLPLVVR